MRHVTLADWSGRTSFVHRLDPRTKFLLLLAFVVTLALLRSPRALQLGVYFLLLLTAIAAARLPPLRVLFTSLLVVPMVGVFSVVVFLSGDRHRAGLILCKSYLSALSVLICIATTPVPELLSAARAFRVPVLLLEVTQLIYRYLFVLVGQARSMQVAFSARCGKPGIIALRASSGIVGVLFSRSYEKANMLTRSMLARNFSGTLGTRQLPRFKSRDFLPLLMGLLCLLAAFLLF